MTVLVKQSTFCNPWSCCKSLPSFQADGYRTSGIKEACLYYIPFVLAVHVPDSSHVHAACIWIAGRFDNMVGALGLSTYTSRNVFSNLPSQNSCTATSSLAFIVLHVSRLMAHWLIAHCRLRQALYRWWKTFWCYHTPYGSESSIVRSHWVDHSLEISVLKVCSLMYGIFV